MRSHIDARRISVHSDVLRNIRTVQLEKAMQTRLAEIADGVYRLSTFVPEVGPVA